MELPTQEVPESLGTPQVRLEVVRSNAVVTKDDALLATSEGIATEDLSGQDLSEYLGRRFSIRPVVLTLATISPMREVPKVTNPLAPPTKSHPTVTVEPPPPPPLTGSTAKRMLEAVEAAMTTEHTTTADPLIAIEEDVEIYLADVLTRGRQVIVSAQTCFGGGGTKVRVGLGIYAGWLSNGLLGMFRGERMDGYKDARDAGVDYSGACDEEQS